MRILLTARGPKVLRATLRLAHDLGREHTVAIYDSLMMREFNEAGLRMYAHSPLIDVSGSELHGVCHKIKKEDYRHVRCRDIPLWEVTDYERRRDVLNGVPVVPERYIEYAAKMTAACDAILADFRPDVVAVWNGSIVEARIFARLAKQAGAAVFYQERGLVPNALILDPRGVNAESYLCTEAWNEIAATPPGDAELAATRRYLDNTVRAGQSVVAQPGALSPEAIRRKLGLAASTRIIFVPSQIDTDTNVIYNSPFFSTNAEVLQTIREICGGTDDFTLVFKPHPEELRHIDLQKDVGKRGRIVTDISLHSLIAAAEVVVVRNSTVGLEAAALRKPVVVLGKSIYSHKGFTYDLQEKEQLPSLLHQALNEGFSKVMEAKAERFFVHLVTDYHYYIENEPLPGVNNRCLQRLIDAGKAVHPVYPASTSLLKKMPQAQENLLERWRQEDRAVSDIGKLHDTLAQKNSGAKVLIIQSADPGPFGKAVKLIASWKLPLRYSILASHPDKLEELSSLPGIETITCGKRAGVPQLLKARLGQFEAVIYASSRSNHLSRNTLLTRKLLAGVEGYILDCEVGIPRFLAEAEYTGS